jgi:succinylarginine dihydrolase
MWTANAATIAPSSDTEDGKLHVTPANLAYLFHRRLEARHTTRVLQTVFADPERFVVHRPLPGALELCDEGAANHTRLSTDRGAVHLFGWGRRGFEPTSVARPGRHPARQTLEASDAVARLHQLRESVALPWQQSPLGIDAGSFHSDVLAVGVRHVFLLHELAFVRTPELLEVLRQRLGPSFRCRVASERELPVKDAVLAYPFNSQLLETVDGRLRILAPTEAEANAASRAFLESVVAEPELGVGSLHFVDVNASMQNGGGPACLRLRVPMTALERAALGGNVLWSDALGTALEAWVRAHYRERLSLAELADPALLDEGRRALDELTQILALGSIYDFQRP